MEFHPADPLTLVSFVLIVVFVLCCVVAGAKRAGWNPLKVVAVLALWLFSLALAVGSGWLEAEPMPRVMIFLAGINLVTLIAAFSRFGGDMATRVPIFFLVAFQCFRFPLELVLHSWAEQGVIPATMTWTGQNFDVFSGLVAIAAAPWVPRFRVSAWVANVIGFVLLLNVIRVAALSSPVPFGWQLNPPLLLAFHLPYALIVPVCVAGALFGHVVLTRALLQPKPTREN